MTHKPALNARVLRRAVLLIAPLTILVALVILAPLTDARQPSGRLSLAFLPQDASAGSGPLFLSGVNYRVPFQSAGSLAAADVNGDGIPDVVVASVCNQVGCDSVVSVLLGNGDGTLQPAVSYDTGGTLALSIAVADVNGDGRPDVLVAECGPTQCVSGAHGLVGVLLGKGDGTFQTAVTYDSGGAGANAVAVADVNGDGKPDLIVTSCTFSGSSCSNGLAGVLLGNGDGTFKAAVTHNTGAFSANAVSVADLNGDGKLDLIVTNNVSTSGLSVLLGNGNGSFKPAVTHNFGGVGFSVEVADLNGDGKMDVVMASCVAGSTGCTSSVSVLLGKGDGTFQPVVSYSSGGRGARSVAIADVDGDGRLDLLVANQFSNTSTNAGVMGVLLGNGDGTFQTAHPFSTGTGQANPSVTVADVNGDGRLDALVGKSVVAVLLNGGAFNGTTTKVTTSGSPSIFGQLVKFTATVSSPLGIRDGETITFHDGLSVIGTGMTAMGLATFSTSSLKVGGHSIQAVYPGDAANRPSTGRVTQVVNLDPTTTTLTSKPNPSTHGQPVIFTARVTSSGPNPPTGKVAFKDGTTVIGSATLSGGVATLTKSSLTVGTHSITAQYSGDSTSAKSTSAPLSQVVN